MPHSHKKKTLAVKRCLAVGLLAIAAAIGVLFGPSALVLAQGPTRIDPLADNDVGALQGKYLEADHTGRLLRRDGPARVHHARQYARRDDLHRCRTA